MKKIYLIYCMLPLLIACQSPNPSSPSEYLSLAPAEKNAANHPKIQAFSKLFNQLDELALEKQVAETYAEQLYFNDTVVTLYDRKSLTDYLQHTQNNLEGIEFKVLSIMEHGNDLWVRWQMRTRFSVLTRSLDIESIGISHLRFNDANLIVLHQDFWDSTQGFYQHLPILGGLIQWIKHSIYP